MCSSSYDSKKSDSTEDSNNRESTSSSLAGERFVFPRAPRLCKSISNSPCSLSCRSDSSISDGILVRVRRRGRRRNRIRSLPPIGVFWDIENCQVPRNKSATSIVQRIRELFYNDYREAEFLVVCDVKKESAHIIQDLNDAQVNLIHVSSTSKNAADEKLRQSLRRFAELYRNPAAVALITSDVNFAADLSDLRYRKKIHVILVHNSNVADALILCASETYSFLSITESIPSTPKQKREIKTIGAQTVDLCIYNLPVNIVSERALKLRLKLLSDNCGGRVTAVDRDFGTAVLKFTSFDFAKRAQKRLDGEDVFGNKISVGNPRQSPSKNYTGRRVRNTNGLYQIPPIPIPQTYGHPGLNSCIYSANTTFTWDFNQEMFASQQPAFTQSSFRPIRGAGYTNVAFNDHQSANRTETILAAPAVHFGDLGVDSKTKNTNGVIELIVSNLDSSINNKDLYKILLNRLKQYAMVLSLTITTQADGSPMACVKVGKQQEAQYIISQLHHQWLGCKRMSISYAQTNSDPNQLRFMIVSLLQEVPGNRMPLFKFFELAHLRYHCRISLSEVNKLKDVCKISDGSGGRTIALNPEANISSTHLSNYFVQYCTMHCPNGLENRGWGESEEITLPNIRISLKGFSAKVNQLLVSHLGCIPLLSFSVCYRSEFKEHLPIDEAGVPLEHLVTCISNVELVCSGQNKSVKFLKMKNSQDKLVVSENLLLKSVSPSLLTNINMLCREMVDLLKTTERCQLLLSRFIPAYHHHFGRQCRVADYGFTRLMDLFEAISHIVQIMGSGTMRTITLTHSAQVRRFTSDLLRVVKVQVSSQIALADFASAYEKVLHKPFNPVEYGLCSLDDLLEEIPENTVVVANVNNVVIIGIKKKDQTPEQMQLTRQFAFDVVELLSHSAYCTMLFNKFVPAYHHHFGRQCKVSDYGFAKLAELFEAIPETVELEGTSDVDRKIKLKLPLALEVLGNQIQKLIKNSPSLLLYLEALPTAYKQLYGYTLKPEAYSCKDLKELIEKLGDFVQIVKDNNGLLIILANVDNFTLEIRVWLLLMYPPHSSTIKTFIHDYRIRFHNALPITKLEQLKNVVTLSNDGNETIVSLTDFYIMAAQIYHLLYVCGGTISYNDMDNIYLRKFGKPLCTNDWRANSLDLLKNMNFLLTVKGNKNPIVTLNKQLADYNIPLPLAFGSDTQDNKVEENAWPPLEQSSSNIRRITPPKPDTPPTENYGNSTFWNSPSKEDSPLNLSIPSPVFDASKVLMDTKDLISPTRSLLCAHSYPLNVIPKITAPDPMVLPLPDKLIVKDELSDSGVNTTRIEYTLSDNEGIGEPFEGTVPNSKSFQAL